MALNTFLGFLSGFLILFHFYAHSNEKIRSTREGAQALEIFEKGALKFFNWRATAFIRRDLKLITRFLLRWFRISFLLLLVAAYFRSEVLVLAITPLFIFTALSCLSFVWAFNRRSVVKIYRNIYLLFLLGISFSVVSDLLSGRNTLTVELLHPFMEMLNVTLTSPFVIAASAAAFVLTMFGIFYLFAWLILTPPAYAVAIALWTSSVISAYSIKKFNRDFLINAGTLARLAAIVIGFVALFA